MGLLFWNISSFSSGAILSFHFKQRMCNVYINSVLQCFPKTIITWIQIWRYMRPQSTYYLLLLWKWWALESAFPHGTAYSYIRATQWRIHELHGHFCNTCIYYSGYLHSFSMSSLPQPWKTLALQALNLLMEVSPLCWILFFFAALAMHDIIHKTLAHFFPWCTICRSTANERTHTSFNETPFWYMLTTS